MLRQERDVEAELRGLLIDCLLIGVEQIDEQSRESALVENIGNVAIARAMARAAAAVREDHNARRRGRHDQLALKSGRNYQAGDQISYYVTGDGKRVSVYDNCKLAADFNPARRDENIDYYLDKLSRRLTGEHSGDAGAAEPVPAE